MFRTQRISTVLALSTVMLAACSFAQSPDRQGPLGLFEGHRDVGKTRHGKATFDGAKKTYIVSGAGDNIWTNADAFQYLFRQLDGDVTLTADVAFDYPIVFHHSKAALMIRQGFSADAVYADIVVHPDGLAALQYRTAPGRMTDEVRSDVKGPTRLRISRRGDQITVAVGTPGQELKRAGPVTVPMSGPVYVGFAVCSHVPPAKQAVIFSNVSIEKP